MAPSTAREAVDTEATASSVGAAAENTGAVAAENIHSIGHVAPHGRVVFARFGRRSARGQLIPAIGLPKVAQVF